MICKYTFLTSRATLHVKQDSYHNLRFRFPCSWTCTWLSKLLSDETHNNQHAEGVEEDLATCLLCAPLKASVKIYKDTCTDIWWFPEIGVPQIIHFNGIFDYKPTMFDTYININFNIWNLWSMDYLCTLHSMECTMECTTWCTTASDDSSRASHRPAHPSCRPPTRPCRWPVWWCVLLAIHQKHPETSRTQFLDRSLKNHGSFTIKWTSTFREQKHIVPARKWTASDSTTPIQGVMSRLKKVS